MPANRPSGQSGRVALLIALGLLFVGLIAYSAIKITHKVDGRPETETQITKRSLIDEVTRGKDGKLTNPWAPKPKPAVADSEELIQDQPTAEAASTPLTESPTAAVSTSATKKPASSSNKSTAVKPVVKKPAPPKPSVPVAAPPKPEPEEPAPAKPKACPT